jgi:hypothetical protein
MGPKKARVPAEGSSGGCLLRGLDASTHGQDAILRRKLRPENPTLEVKFPGRIRLHLESVQRGFARPILTSLKYQTPFVMLPLSICGHFEARPSQSGPFET